MGVKTYPLGELPARFASKVDVASSGCWLWTASKNQGGYGRFSVDGRLVTAHRWAYEQLVGSVPDGLELDHLCRCRACVNPAHLQPVSHRENVMRSEGLAAANAVKTRCPRGHPLDGDNLVASALRRGERKCRTCHSAANARSYQRRIARGQANG